MIKYNDILNSRICDLGLSLQKSSLYPRILELYKSLRDRNLRFRPPCYFADEWFVPEGDPVIGIPFYLGSKKLISLEKKMMAEAEGHNYGYFMKLLRHEAGHATSYAYQLKRKKAYSKVFGDSGKMFREVYRFNKKSRKFVHHLNDFYAQSHPDEDFAETFAVWLTHPEHKWRQIYRGWGALNKLIYVDELMAGIVGKTPPVKTGEKMCHVKTLKFSVWTYYMRRRSLVYSHRKERR